MVTFTSVENIAIDHDVCIDQSNPVSVWKRLFDLMIASLVAVSILVWMIPMVGLLIKLTSPGPIIFVQWRTGINGKPFPCYKFRTMVNSSKNSVFKQTSFNDSRITPIGNWLRKTNLDEMPQFLNVLMGSMSVVGPRPHAIQHDAEYWFSLPDYRKRYTVLPGITGLAQVRGARGIADDPKKMKQRLRYDLFYIKKGSCRYDAQICWWTMRSMFRGDPNAW